MKLAGLHGVRIVIAYVDKIKQIKLAYVDKLPDPRNIDHENNWPTWRTNRFCKGSKNRNQEKKGLRG